MVVFWWFLCGMGGGVWVGGGGGFCEVWWLIFCRWWWVMCVVVDFLWVVMATENTHISIFHNLVLNFQITVWNPNLNSVFGL